MTRLAKFIPRTRWTPIGLDVGENGYRAAQLRTSRGTAVLERCLHVDARVGSPSGESAPTTFRRIRDDLRGAGFRRSDIITAASVSEVEFHLLDLPSTVLNRPEAEAAEAIRWEVARGVNGTIDDYEVRHWAAPASSAGGPTAIAVSVRRKTVTSILDACGTVGLVCAGVDSFATALCRLGCALRRPDPRSVWGILDVGLGQSRLVLCVDEVPVLVRHVGTGGQMWTEQIAESLHLSPKAAEVQKRDHGIASSALKDSVDEAETRDREVGALLLGALRSELAQLTNEVKRSYEYVLTFQPQRHAGDLLLVGSGAKLKRLPEFLAGALGIPVLRSSACLGVPPCVLSCPSTRPDEFDSCSLAVGLAMAGGVD